MTYVTDCDELVKALRKLSPNIKRSNSIAWSRPAALRIIDCVLSLNRNYNKFVVPRLNNFEMHYPYVHSITDLEIEIKRYLSADAFVRQTLNYNHVDRAIILENVTSWMSTVSGAGDPDTQLAKLEKWAKETTFINFKETRIRGFGLAGFQYLRMLFGANTTKPDVKIRRWVEGIVGHAVSAVQALKLMEDAAAKAAVSLRDADTTIWSMLNKSQ